MAESRRGPFHDRERSEKALIDATRRLIARNGFKKLGVNAVAREACLDKVLIYRYFDGLDGLIRAFGKSTDFWPTADEIFRGAVEGGDRHHFVGRMMVAYLRAVRARPLTLEILAWEMADRTSLVEILEGARESLGQELMGRAITEHGIVIEGTDIAAVTGLMAAGIHYITVRSRFIDGFNGIALDEDGWRRYESALLLIFDRLLGAEPE
ncbi:MAG: helix-turn-helix domain-containing protein [Planctomycetota bacterium]